MDSSLENDQRTLIEDDDEVLMIKPKDLGKNINILQAPMVVFTPYGLI